jgi:hypothetical protein
VHSRTKRRDSLESRVGTGARPYQGLWCEGCPHRPQGKKKAKHGEQPPRTPWGERPAQPQHCPGLEQDSRRPLLVLRVLLEALLLTGLLLLGALGVLCLLALASQVLRRQWERHAPSGRPGLLLRLPQCLEQRLGAGGARLGRLGQQMHGDAAQDARHPWVERVGRGWQRGFNRHRQLWEGQPGVEGVAVREGLVEQHSQGVQVAGHSPLEARALPPRLGAKEGEHLGGHRVQGTHHPSLRERGGSRQRHHAEVDEEGPLLLAAHQEVVGLQVTVVDAPAAGLEGGNLRLKGLHRAWAHHIHTVIHLGGVGAHYQRHRRAILEACLEAEPLFWAPFPAWLKGKGAVSYVHQGEVRYLLVHRDRGALQLRGEDEGGQDAGRHVHLRDGSIRSGWQGDVPLLWCAGQWEGLRSNRRPDQEAEEEREHGLGHRRLPPASNLSNRAEGRGGVFSEWGKRGD